MFKGGVYKTMTTVLTASALAAAPYNKRVLIVDADSQCNATAFFTPEPVDWQDDLTAPAAQEGHNGVADGGARAGGSASGAGAGVGVGEGAGAGVGVGGGAKAASNVSLSEPGLKCPRKDPLPGQFFKSDTWLDCAGKKFNTIYDVLEPEFDHGSRGMQVPDILPVEHFQKRTTNSAEFDPCTQVICQECGNVHPKPSRKVLESTWFCSDACREAKEIDKCQLFLLPGSTKLSRLESRMSDDLEQGGQYLIWESFDRLFNMLAEYYGFDYIFVDLGPNHGKLNMAFALNCHAILPPLHADFYSATSMCRMLEHKGVLNQWNDWRCKFVEHCDKHRKPRGSYAQMPKLLPFLVSGYDTERSKKDKAPRVTDKDTGFESGKVEKDKAVFVASMQLAVKDLDVAESVREMFKPDGAEMVIPFCRSMKHGVVVSETMGVPMHQIYELDVRNCFDGVGWTSKKFVQTSDDVWGKQENRDDFVHADFKYSAGRQCYEKAKEEMSEKGNKDFVDKCDRLRAEGKLKDDCLASFLEAFARDRCAVAVPAPFAAPEPSLAISRRAAESSRSDDASPHLPVLNMDSRPTVPFLKPLEGTGAREVTPKCCVISVFNYKGGVAKTTTAIELAATLAKKGSKVCLVDADGQCNCTAFFHPKLKFDKQPPVARAYQQAQAQRKIPADELPAATRACAVDSFKPFTWLQSGDDYDFDLNNIHGMLAPVFSAAGRLDELKAPTLLSVDPGFYDGNLLLLPGSIELSTVRLKHREDKDECRQFGVLRKLFKMIAQAYSTADSPLEFIIVDLGPSVDDLNKAFVMSSDYVLPPVKADYFSASSVRGLLYEVLPQFRDWQRKHKRKVEDLLGSERKRLEEDGFYTFKDAEWPRLLPFLVCGHPVEKKEKEPTMEQVSADFLHSIRILVEESGDADGDDDEFSPDVRAGVKRMIVRDKDGHAAVPFCKDLPLAPSVGHRSGVPFVHLGRLDKNVDFDKHRKDVGAGSHANTGKTECKYAKERFAKLAEFVREQRRICLRERYGIDEEASDADENGEPLADQGGPSSVRKTKRSLASQAVGTRKSSRLSGGAGGGDGASQKEH